MAAAFSEILYYFSELTKKFLLITFCLLFESQKNDSKFFKINYANFRTPISKNFLIVTIGNRTGYAGYAHFRFDDGDHNDSFPTKLKTHMKFYFFAKNSCNLWRKNRQKI